MNTSPSKSPLMFWLFVRVIDNFGDAGVAWRLARALRDQIGARICLWCDDLHTLQRIGGLPEKDISVRRWHEFLPETAPTPDVVVEMFGCTLPESAQQAVAQAGALWLNWEYLTAEDWAAECHLLPSPQNNGALKYFWFMGTADHLGGLLCETDYAGRKAAFDADAFCRQYRLPKLPENKTGLIFGYENANWSAWLDMLEAAGENTVVWLAGGAVVRALIRAGRLPENFSENSPPVQQGCLTLCAIALIPQTDFDGLLWAADWAVVRGEDSFVRAQLSGTPFFWHIYPQDDFAHHDKLDAYLRSLPQTPQTDKIRRLSHDLNALEALDAHQRAALWQSLNTDTCWFEQCRDISGSLVQQENAVCRLVKFIDKHRCDRIKSAV